MSVSLDDVVQQTANIEAAEEADDLVIGIGDDDLLDDVRDVLSHEGGHAEFVLHEVEGSEDVEAARAEAAAIGARVVEAEFSEERKRAFKEENEDVTGTR
jgi:hypothetical protein